MARLRCVICHFNAKYFLDRKIHPVFLLLKVTHHGRVQPFKVYIRLHIPVHVVFRVCKNRVLRGNRKPKADSQRSIDPFCR